MKFPAKKTNNRFTYSVQVFLAGNFMLLAFVWILFKYRKRKLIIIAATNLMLMAVQAWFGSIVVASNLVPWTITVHMLLALVIIGLQLYIIWMISPAMKRAVTFPKWMLILLWVCFGITIYQMFLGTQVRESIDELRKLGYHRESWANQLGLQYYIHRSFSWLVLILLSVMAWMNERGAKMKMIRALFVVLALELVSGVLLVHANMPGLVQTSHLIFATILFGILTMGVIRGKLKKQLVDHGQVLN